MNLESRLVRLDVPRVESGLPLAGSLVGGADGRDLIPTLFQDLTSIVPGPNATGDSK